MTFLDFLSSYISGLAADRRAATAAQARQSPAQLFAAAWNAGRLRLPADYLYSVQDPATGASVQCAPWCDAAVDDASCLRLALSVPPDAPIGSADLAAHAEEVRLLARAFFQVGMRIVGTDSYRDVFQMALASVRPQIDETGSILLGFDDTGSPVQARFIGEATAISGCDAQCLPWLASSYAAIERRTLDPQTAIASTRAAARQARAGADVPYTLIDIGDASCPENARPERIRDLAESRRGLVMSSRGDVDADGWAIRPTQLLRRSGSVYTLERDGRQLKFLPAWLY